MKKRLLCFFLFCLSLVLTGCAASGKRTDGLGLIFDHSMELHYAEQFSADYYEGGYALVTVSDGSRYLIVPEGLQAPEKREADIVVLQQPISQVYLVASAVMDMFVSMDELDRVRFSGLKPDGWYIEEVREAMDAGDILYAGKYSAPDYETLLSERCGLAIENTMIHHVPEVREQLEKLGIPVIVDYSSYEESPLGRMEWIRFYGLLMGKEAEAEAVFEKQAEPFEALVQRLKQETDENTQIEDAFTGEHPTVAFFYINSSGVVNVRRSSDYLPKMIRMAGGTYVFDRGSEPEGTSSTYSMQMEEFYAAARDADFLIYNSTVEGELVTVEDLKEKHTLLGQFKAVQDGRVYCTSRNLYQSSMELGTILTDICRMLEGRDDGLTYLYRLE